MAVTRMDDEGQHTRESASDVALERRLGTRGALLALWNPSGQPFAVTWNDSSIITADRQTRSRLTQAHSVVHALLRDDHAIAVHRLINMSGLMTAFTALRSLTLTSELLWNTPAVTWRKVLVDAHTQAIAIAANDMSGALPGIAAIAKAVNHNLTGESRQRILDCVAGVASTLPTRARRGLGIFGAAALVAALKTTSSGTHEELTEEHAALLVAIGHGSAITHRDGRLVTE